MKGKRQIVRMFCLLISDPDPDPGSPLKFQLDNTLWSIGKKSG
jgi:hypothetical protein